MQIKDEPFDKKYFSRRHYPLWVCLGAFLILLVGLIGIAFSYLSYSMVKKTTLSATTQLSERISDITELTVSTIQQPTYRLLDTLSKSELGKARTLDERLASFPYVASLLLQQSDINSIYTGYENGDFFYVRTIGMGMSKMEFEIPKAASFLVQSSENRPDGKKLGVLLFDQEMNLIERVEVKDNFFDPRTRVWYEQALQDSGPVSTSPYHYFNSNEAGVTFSHASPDGKSVTGIDVRLDVLFEKFRKLLPTASSRIALLKPDGSLVAYIRGTMQEVSSDKSSVFSLAQEDSAVLLRAREEYRSGKRGLTEAINIDGQAWFLFLRELTDDHNAVDKVLLLAMPQAEVMHDADSLLQSTINLALILLLLSLPIAWLMAQYAVKPLRSLAEQAKRIREFCFDDDIEVASSVQEIDLLARTLLTLKENITRFLRINLNISSERDFKKLLETILGEILDVTNADGGAITLLDEESHYLPDMRVRWKNLGAEKRLILAECPKEFLPESGDFYSGKAVHTSLSWGDPLAALEILAPAFNDPETDSLDIIHIPLRNSNGDCLGTLSLFMQVKSAQANFEQRQIAFCEVLASTAAIALENHRLLEAHNKLFDALVKIIAGAIDAKSPYTGGHCQRVPVIFDLLLNAACTASEGPFKDFTLSDDERREAYLAAWLHDCGKVTTPEYVVDKATKLETIYDRIHEVRMRFEVLKRDAEISYLRDLFKGGVAKEREQCEQQLAEELDVLDKDFAFVAQCNIGGEFLGEEAVERLQEIAKRSWLRTIDNRLGVSQAEGERIGKTLVSLPVREPLLSDKPEHIIPRADVASDSQEISRFGFKMASTLHLYNRGELHNLGVSRGTLSDEERYKINEHITQTIIMLNNLPLPKYLKNIPEIACNHHETLDGKGYPRALNMSGLSVKSRMMAIADIFEALTAGDRPYKPRKTLSEALAIMEGFRDREHIDPELYELFIKSGIAKTYAAKYLHPEQCDI